MDMRELGDALVFADSFCVVDRLLLPGVGRHMHKLVA